MFPLYTPKNTRRNIGHKWVSKISNLLKIEPLTAYHQPYKQILSVDLLNILRVRYSTFYNVILTAKTSL